MSIDYDRLRALLDETALGPWEVEQIDAQYADCPTSTMFYLDGADMEIAVREAVDRNYGRVESSFALMALAPVMARELLRLRRELTDLRDLMQTHAQYLAQDGLRAAAEYAYDHALRLTRVLDGGTE